jgi:hypothetical protein
MARAIPLEVRVADLPQMKDFTGAVAALIGALGESGDLPEPVMVALERVRLATEALTGRNIGPAPDSDEDRIRTAMNAATENPGRVVTVED